MKTIDESRLETDLDYRFEYLTEFIGFSEADVSAIQNVAEAISSLIPRIVDLSYEKMFKYDAAKRHFVPKQTYYEGEVPADIDSLQLDHPMISFRKEHLGRYLAALVSKPYDGKMAAYLDMVGKMHTTLAGSESINVPLVQMNALMGFLADALNAAVLSLNLDRDVEIAVLRAFNKVLWIQNDLITKHYAPS